MMKMRTNSNSGFTFIEVMVAMMIFVLAVIAASSIGSGAVRATREAKEISVASWLLQSKMTELETKLETLGIDKGCDKKKDGKFDEPYDSYTWTVYCYPIDFNLSQAASKLTAAQTGSDSAKDPEQENQIQKMILDSASDYMSKALRELHVEVNWLQGKTKRQVTVTTHFARYDLPLTMGGLTAPGGGGTSGSGGGNGGANPGTTTPASPGGATSAPH